ncbi:PAS domain-containing protein [Streptomyces sp. DSM 41528]|uniref:PAS domain-containing protein n=1 Tax=Streptomyces bugieae TaxID=3098223 RepID=A0ABU7NR47_9ACTN|nr:PAS domain-containing protein [Streptomyces nigrescens]MEE4421273.1 PAS domain-containing protein [Streptomyces sp. DSM 41528]
MDGMDAALVAFTADRTVTHWNHEAERILGWTTAEAVGRTGLAGWAVRKEDAEGIETVLTAAMRSPGRQVHEFALLTKDGHRVLVRTQCSAVRGPDGRVAGAYCAFSEVHTQIDLERSIALSEALFEDASWGVVLVDADLRPAVVNAHAARALGVGRTALLGRPLGELLDQGVEELECALQHVLGEGAPPAVAEFWVTLRSEDAEHPRRCWRSGFVRLASPLAEEPVPLGVAWLFQDVTDAKRAEQDGSLLRFRAHQLHRAGRAAAECPDPSEAAAVHLDFALAGFADHGLVDLAANHRAAPAPYGTVTADDTYEIDDAYGLDGAHGTDPADGTDDACRTEGSGGTGGACESGDGGRAAGRAGLGDEGAEPVGERAGAPCGLVRTLASPAGSPGPCVALTATGIPVPYVPGHPALQAYARRGSVRTSAGAAAPESWAAARHWPDGAVHGLCVVLRSRGRTLGVLTFLRSPARRPFDRADAEYAEEVAARIAAALDLAGASSC